MNGQAQRMSEVAAYLRGRQDGDCMDKDAAIHCDQAMHELIRQQARSAELEALVYVPGEWHCPKCNLVLLASVMAAANGEMYTDDKPQQCANGCGPMWRVSERQARIQARKDYCEEWDKRSAADTRIAELEALVAYYKRDADREWHKNHPESMGK